MQKVTSRPRMVYNQPTYHLPEYPNMNMQSLDTISTFFNGATKVMRDVRIAEQNRRDADALRQNLYYDTQKKRMECELMETQIDAYRRERYQRECDRLAAMREHTAYMRQANNARIRSADEILMEMRIRRSY